MRNIEIFKSVVKGVSLRIVASKNLLSCPRIARIVIEMANIIVKHDPYMKPVNHASIAYLRKRAELWLWASDQLEQS